MPKTWIVSLHARSAVRIANNTVLSILATPESTVPVSVLRIRNQIARSTEDPNGPKFAGALVAEAAGSCASADEAAALLGNLASPYFQAAAVAANAAVDDPQDMLVFSPPASEIESGEFVVQRTAHPRSPAPVIRDLPADQFGEMLRAIDQHPREDRIHRALAHYRMALSNMAPDNWILAGESLFIVVENLARVVAQRLAHEAGLADGPGWKHQLALTHGINPKDEDDRSHLSRFDSWVREQHIFSGDRDCYRRLLRASDAFEHGFSGFDRIRELTNESAEKAFGYVRKAILRELGIGSESGLLGPQYDLPLGDWRPVLEIAGTYTDTALKAGPGFTPDDFRDRWPDFLGPNVIPGISRVIDNPDGSRSVDLTVNLHGDTLSDSQTLTPTSTTWLLPQKEVGQTTGTPELRVVTKNGADITDEVGLGEGSDDDPAA